ncbi:hypothetical protein P171DRAFT_426568 [Karstenula rhodostoma CBS 690.94]|uniref:Uncharacterized protein n=1 Tax=Karstenula rhodostoma CBS 690.94 TaxID=1392251 RepID=A0A9P4PXR6_9PLEO|nr:hypothetical protein P171DRAFT_426568 [Karstenula rhodostoma CBS 690.94]
MTTGLLCGSPYARASRQAEEDSVSMLLPVGATSPEQPHPNNRRKSSSGDGMSQRTPSWLISPPEPQDALPHEQRRVSSPPPNMGFSVLGDSARSQSPYQEQVAWANSTQFRSAPAESKPQMVQTILLATVDETPPSSHKYFRHPRHMLEPWMNGVWMRFPWWGAGALFLIVLLTGASAGILLASHGTTMDDWKIGRDNAQPHVYISVFEMMMIFLILFALVEGVVIRFWRQLLQGTTLDALHDTYESMYLWPAARRISRVRFNLVAVACVLASVSFARGPLFQRALTISDNTHKSLSGMVDLKIAPHPLVEFFTNKGSNPLEQGGVTPFFAELVKGLGAGNPLAYDQPASCGDYCVGVVKGYTFKVTCDSSIRHTDLNTLLQECKACTTEQCKSNCEFRRTTSLSSTFFSTSYESAHDRLVLNSIHKNTTSCSGDVHVQTCTLTPTKSDIPFVLTNGTIDRRIDIPTSQVYDAVSTTDNAIMETYWPLALNTLFPSVSVNVSASPDFSQLDHTKCVHTANLTNSPRSTDTSVAATTCSNSTVDPALFTNDPSAVYSAKYSPSTGEDALCGTTWSDPMPDMINLMQTLAFHTTIATATAPASLFAPSLTGAALVSLRSSWTQRIPVTGHRTLPVYHTSPLLVALGIAVSLLGVAAVIPLYYGFWELGRKVSLNPLEIARAFGAPLMEGLDGNTTPDMITVERGGMGVKYGAVDRYGEQKKLRVEESGKATVRVPWRGEIFG